MRWFDLQAEEERSVEPTARVQTPLTPAGLSVFTDPAGVASAEWPSLKLQEVTTPPGELVE
jgi:hypothetical protein